MLHDANISVIHDGEVKAVLELESEYERQWTARQIIFSNWEAKNKKLTTPIATTPFALSLGIIGGPSPLISPLPLQPM